MASKSKKSAMSLPPEKTTRREPSVPGLPSDARRRSGRLQDKSDLATRTPPDSESSGIQGQTQFQSKPGKHPWDEETHVAMDGLKQMEDEMRDVVKRQKKAVKDSEVPMPSEGLEQSAAFLPRATKAEPDILSGKREKAAVERHMWEKTGPVEYTVQGGEEGRFPEAEEYELPLQDSDITVMKQEAARPPPVNSEYLPLPWKGRLGYACLNTYLRNSNPPVFSSRTCRISSIIENRHPLRDPSQPAHATKNRPDKEQPADVDRGQKHVEALGIANARDIVKMIRWNHKYGIKFMRLSSEMFPFASHEEYGYKLAPFASEVLAEAGMVAANLGHRLTMHPGQFTQLGSPRTEVVRSAVRDLEYHNELLSLLRLPEQQNKNAVMIIHMGGVFGDKAATLDRFRENYSKLSDEIKGRLVLENDDVSWTVHDLLPICEELNIPFVLDYHHHNIMFDKDKIREGTKDIMELYPRIKATWDRKGITQKMHYSEPCPDAVTPRQRRKHRPRVMMLPPCPDTMDLMIEAKDKEQAVFDLMRNYRLPGWDTFNDVIPYEREDENRPLPKTPKKSKPRKKKAKDKDDEDDMEDADMNEAPGDRDPLPEVPEEELSMGGPNHRVYWPIGMEEWLRPKKREVKKKLKTEDEQ